MNIQALAFDTGGTVLDWHSGLARALHSIGSRHGIDRDLHAMANDWRRRTMRQIVCQVHPAFHMDDVHRCVLDETLAEFDRLRLHRGRLRRPSRTCAGGV